LWDVEPKFIALVKTTDKLIIDLTDVSFMSSVGMRTIVVTAKSLREKGGKLVLASPQAEVEKALKTTGVDTIISIVPDVNAAIGPFSVKMPTFRYSPAGVSLTSGRGRKALRSAGLDQIIPLASDLAAAAGPFR